MARKGERLGSSDDGRVLSERVSVSLRRGQSKEIAAKAAKEGKTSSRVVQEAVDSWIFDKAKVAAMHSQIKRRTPAKKG